MHAKLLLYTTSTLNPLSRLPVDVFVSWQCLSLSCLSLSGSGWSWGSEHGAGESVALHVNTPWHRAEHSRAEVRAPRLLTVILLSRLHHSSAFLTLLLSSFVEAVLIYDNPHANILCCELYTSTSWIFHVYSMCFFVNMWPWSTKPVISSTSIFMAIAIILFLA